MTNSYKIKLSFSYFNRIVRILSFISILSLICIVFLILLEPLSTSFISLWVLVLGVASVFIPVLSVSLVGYWLVSVFLNNSYLMSRFFPVLKSITVFSAKGYKVKLRLEFIQDKSFFGWALWGLGDIPLATSSYKVVTSFRDQGYIYTKDNPFVFYPANKPVQYSLIKE